MTSMKSLVSFAFALVLFAIPLSSSGAPASETTVRAATCSTAMYVDEDADGDIDGIVIVADRCGNVQKI